MKKFIIKRLPRALQVEGREVDSNYTLLTSLREKLLKLQFQLTDIHLGGELSETKYFTMVPEITHSMLFKQMINSWITNLMMDPFYKTRPPESNESEWYSFDIEFNGIAFYGCIPVSSEGLFTFKYYKFMKGRLITVEGADGSGKTTNAKHLADALRALGFDVVTTREPGGTGVAEDIRYVLLQKREGEQLAPLTELLLFSAARAQHLEKKILPALAAGKIVVCDRFCDTSFAYQGYGRGLLAEYLQMEKLVHDGFEPDHTLFFDIDLPQAERRLSARSNEINRLDDEKLEFKKKCMEGYNIRYNQNPHRMFYIDGGQDEQKVKADVISWVVNIFTPQNEGLRIETEARNFPDDLPKFA